MTTSSVPLSAIVGFTKNLRVFDSLGRSEMASCFLPAERSAVGTNSPPFFTDRIFDFYRSEHDRHRRRLDRDGHDEKAVPLQLFTT